MASLQNTLGITDAEIEISRSILAGAEKPVEIAPVVSEEIVNEETPINKVITGIAKKGAKGKLGDIIAKKQAAKGVAKTPAPEPSPGIKHGAVDANPDKNVKPKIMLDRDQVKKLEGTAPKTPDAPKTPAPEALPPATVTKFPNDNLGIPNPPKKMELDRHQQLEIPKPPAPTPKNPASTKDLDIPSPPKPMNPQKVDSTPPKAPKEPMSPATKQVAKGAAIGAVGAAVAVGAGVGINSLNKGGASKTPTPEAPKVSVADAPKPETKPAPAPTSTAPSATPRRITTGLSIKSFGGGKKPAAKKEMSADDLNAISHNLARGQSADMAAGGGDNREYKRDVADRIKNRMNVLNTRKEEVDTEQEIKPKKPMYKQVEGSKVDKIPNDNKTPRPKFEKREEELDIDWDAIIAEAEATGTHTGKIKSSKRIVKALQNAAEKDEEVVFNFDNGTSATIQPSIAKLALAKYNRLSPFQRAQAAKVMRASFKEFIQSTRGR